jgi:hypothetical protein
VCDYDIAYKSAASQQKDLSMFVYGFDSFTVTAYFNLLVIALENGFRSFYKHVCPSNKEPYAFFNVYDDILKEPQLTRYFELMEILLGIRNAVAHQNYYLHEWQMCRLWW